MLHSGRDKHSSLLRKSVNYGGNKLYDAGPKFPSVLGQLRYHNNDPKFESLNPPPLLPLGVKLPSFVHGGLDISLLADQSSNTKHCRPSGKS